MIEVNRFLVEKDAELIRAYIKRRNWTMEKDEYGYWFTIFDKGSGIRLRKGDAVLVHFRESLLDGTVCYSSEESGPVELQTGQGTEIDGLEEGLSHLSVGDSAGFIFPPGLAYGLPGDGNRIPRRAVIVYELRVLEFIQK